MGQFVLSGWIATSEILSVVPDSDVTSGSGGVSQPLLDDVLVNGWIAASSLNQGVVNAAFTHSVPDPVFDPLTVRFDATSSSGFADPVYIWSIEGAEYGGATVEHEFGDFGTYSVTLTIVDLAGIGLIDDSTQNVTVADEREQPIESIEEVLNLTLGRHGYEPHKVGLAVDPDAAIRVYGDGVVNAASSLDLITHEVPRFSTLRNILVGGDTDAVYRVYVNDVQVVPKRRIYRHHRDVDILGGATIPLRERDVVRVQVTNEGGGSSEFEASIHGEAI